METRHNRIRNYRVKYVCNMEHRNRQTELNTAKRNASTVKQLEEIVICMAFKYIKCFTSSLFCDVIYMYGEQFLFATLNNKRNMNVCRDFYEIYIPDKTISILKEFNIAKYNA